MTSPLKSCAFLGATVALAVSAATTATAAPSHPTVPWSKVRQGWSLDLWSPDPGGRGGDMHVPTPGREHLYLVDPAGPRYDLMSFSQKQHPSLASWSGQRAILNVNGKDVLADLPTGKATTLTLPAEVTKPATGTDPAYFFNGRSIDVTIQLRYAVQSPRKRRGTSARTSTTPTASRRPPRRC